MESFEFTEDRLADIQSLAQQVFDETDPRSENYKRKLVRPKPNLFLIALFIIAPVLLSVALGVFLGVIGAAAHVKVISVILLNLLYLILFSKKIVVTSVKLYQYFAPDKVRMRCRFEPSCSEYMLLAIEKYGLIKGLKKGIGRLKRCNVDGGGYDYP